MMMKRRTAVVSSLIAGAVVLGGAGAVLAGRVPGCASWLPHPRSKAVDGALDKLPGHRASARCDQAASLPWSWRL